MSALTRGADVLWRFAKVSRSRDAAADTSCLIESEDELTHRKMGPVQGLLAAHRRQAAAISIITLGEFAEGFADPRARGSQPRL